MKKLFLIPLMLLATLMMATIQAKQNVSNNQNKMNMECDTVNNVPGHEMLVRISEIEVYPEYLDEYLSFVRKVGAESVRKEPGVIAIYPMVQKRDSCQIRILEIYASQDAYKKHIASEHFQTYKQGTLHMVKSLDLVDMTPMNLESMNEIFIKMK